MVAARLRLATDLPLMGHLADEIQRQAGADLARHIRDIDRGDDLDDVVADDLALAGYAAQQVRGLVVGEATEAGTEDTRSQWRIEAVGVEGDVIAVRPRNPLEDSIDADLVDFLGADLHAAIGERVVDLLLPGAADGVQPDLGHAADPRYFRGAAHGAAQP